MPDAIEMECCWHSCEPLWVNWKLEDWCGPIAIVSIDHHAIDNPERLDLFPSEARELARHLLAAADEADAAWNIACCDLKPSLGAAAKESNDA